MNHYCTYFDSGFLLQGLALWQSLQRHDPDSVLWVLALDETTFVALSKLGDERLRPVPLSELEAGDPGLVAIKSGRSRVEYFFTISPCLPRWLLRENPKVDCVTYLDADLFFFNSPASLFASMDEAGASVVITAHRFPPWLAYLENHGRYNVGVLAFRNDAAAHAVLDDWRTRCLDWCFDRLEGERYADQKYLDSWPTRFGSAVLVIDHAGVNAAPWNWAATHVEVTSTGSVRLDDADLIVYHFARFRPLLGTWWWQSGQVQYGVMPWSLRQAIHGPYWSALVESRRRLATKGMFHGFARRALRWQPGSLHMLLVRILFGSDWFRVGGCFISGRGGLGQWSGRYLAWRAGRRGRMG